MEAGIFPHKAMIKIDGFDSGDHGEPTLPPNLLPDVVQLAVNQTVDDFNSLVPIVHNECDTVVANLAADYQAAFKVCADSCKEATDNCTGCFLATITEYANRVMDVADKCQAQAKEKLNDVMQNGINYMVSIGVPEPTVDQLTRIVNGVGSGHVSPLGIGGPGHGTGTITPPPNPPPPPPSCPPGYHFTGIIFSDGTPECLKDSDAACPPGEMRNDAGICVPVIHVPPPPPPPGGGGNGGGGGGTGGGGTGDTCDGSAPCLPPAGLGSQTNADGSLSYGKWTLVENYDGCPLGCIFIPCNCMLQGTDICGVPCKVRCHNLLDCTKNPPHTCPDQYQWDSATNTCVHVGTQTSCHFPTKIAALAAAPSCSEAQLGQNPFPSATQGDPWVWYDSTTIPPGFLIDPDTNWPYCNVPANGTTPAYRAYVPVGVGTSTVSCGDRLCVLQTTFHPSDSCGTSEPPPPPPPPPPTTGIKYCAYSDTEFSPPIGYPVGVFGQYGVTDLASLEGAIKTVDSNSGGFFSTLLEGFGFNITGWFASNVAQYALSGYTTIVGYAASYLKDIMPCDSAEYAAAVVNQAIVGILDKVGIIPPAVSQQIVYAQNYNCQYLIPQQSEVDSAYVRGFINHDRWIDAVKMHGICVPWKEKTIQASFSYPSLRESLDAFRRGIIDAESFADLATKNGVKDEDWRNIFTQIACYQIPIHESQIQSIRGIDDDQTAQSLGLDQGYDEWKQGNGIQPYNASGFDDTNSRRLWRSNHHAPDIFTALDALRRLPDGGQIGGTNIEYEGVTQDDVDAVIRASGYPQKWANRLAALTYQPVSIRHLRILYETGVYTQDDLEKAFVKIGYSPEDAADLAKANVRIAEPQKAKLNGLPSVTEIVDLYKQDGLSRNDAVDMLQSSGVRFEDVGNILTTAESQRDATRRKSLVSALKRRFMDGDFDIGQVQSKLIDYGVDSSRISIMVEQWKEELSLVHKLPAASELCKWFTRRFISVDDYLQRMSNLGFDSASAAYYVNNCTADAAEKAAKQSAAEAKKRAADAEKQRKAELKALKDAAPCKPPPKPTCGAKPKKASQSASSSAGTSSPA